MHANQWQDVLDLQLDISGWLTSEEGRLFGANWFTLNYSDPYIEAALRQLAHENEDDEAVPVEKQRAEGARWAYFTGVGVFNAEAVFIDPDMMTVVEAAVAGFHGEPLLETDLITREGFLVLPRPMTLRPTVGVPKGADDEERDIAREQNWSAAYWKAGAGGITLSLFHDMNIPDALDWSRPKEAERIRHLTRWVPTHTVTWPFGKMHPGQGLRLGHEDAQTQMQAIWRLLNQTLAVHTKQQPPRAFMKRALRAKMDVKHITIVRLRRPRQENEHDEHGSVEWSHRWVVGGHWRNQWYPSISLHRQIWISPYVKGPEDLPLVVNKARIFALVR